MTSLKIRKIDFITGVTEFQVYCLSDFNYQFNNFFDDIIPDISINSNINVLMCQELNGDRHSKIYNRLLLN